MGHALNCTLHDILVRYNRMKGKDTLWQPGLDHAGIATQMVVERQLAEEDIDRRDLGREKFIKKVTATVPLSCICYNVRQFFSIFVLSIMCVF